MCCVADVVKYSVFKAFGVLKYVCVGDVMVIFYFNCEAWSCRCSSMGNVSVSSCRCCMFVSCVNHVAVLNAAFCMTWSLLMLVEDGRGILQSRLHDCLVGSHETDTFSLLYFLYGSQTVEHVKEK